MGIVLSLREIGWDGRILCFRINCNRRTVVERWPDLCECAPVTIFEPSQIWQKIAARVAPKDVSALFFCDERFHSTCMNDQMASLYSAAKCWLGTRCELETVLDRWIFYEYLRNRGLADTPVTLKNPCDPWQHFPDGFRARVWRSWRGMKKLPRGRTVRTAKEFDEWRQMCQTQKVADAEWGCQELLSTDPRHTVSVCGWHDPASRYYKVTRWLRQRSENGWLIETLEGYDELRETTRNILSAMEYYGPFELEFMKNRDSEGYKVIELNPRFWMQHRLVGNELVRRYLDLPAGTNESRPQPRYWLNTDEVLKRMLCFKGFGLFPYIRQGVLSTPVRGSVWPVVNDRLRMPLRTASRLGRKFSGRFHGDK